MTQQKNDIKKEKIQVNDQELEELLKLHKTVIKVIGAGGAGNNTITRLVEVGVQEIETIAINTDAQDLLYARSDNKLIIGKNITKGLGAGSDPEIGEQSAKENTEEIKAFIEGADMVFVTCGLGGGTGTGSAPVIAEIAKEMGALTISVVTTPFSDEGVTRKKNAESGLEKLRKNSDTVIVIENDRLIEMVPDLPINAAFKIADEILVNAVKGITELVTKKGLVNLDFADVRTIMKGGGTAMIGIGEGETDGKVMTAVEKAVNNPLLSVDIAGAKNALINIEGDENMSISEARNIMVAVARQLDSNAKIIWGANVRQDMEGKVKILIIATGLNLRNRFSERLTVRDKLNNGIKKGKDSNSFFDLKEARRIVDKNGQKKGADETPDEEAPKNVFTEIFEDEIKADLNMLKQSIKLMNENEEEDKIFRNLKNACIGIHKTSQLYSNKPLEELSLFVGELAEELLTKKINYTPNFKRILNKLPQIIDGILAGYSIAVDDAYQLIEELSLLIDQRENKPKPKNQNNNQSKKNDSEESDFIDDELKLEKSDLQDKLKMELN